MAADWIASFKMVQEWLTSPRTMCAFLLGTAILLGLIAGIEHQNLEYLLSHYLILCFVCTTCAAGLITLGLFGMGFRFTIRHRLNHLASDEKKIISRFIDNDVSTVQATFGEPGANSLVDDGILRVTSETGRVHQKVGVTYYTILPYAFRYLRKRKIR
jgi:Super-infection exclusion protein B